MVYKNIIAIIIVNSFKYLANENLKTDESRLLSKRFVNRRYNKV